MDGYEVARRLRAEAMLAQAQLYALTGYGQPGDDTRAQEAGFDGHLVKPASLQEIGRLLHKASKLPAEASRDKSRIRAPMS